LRISNTKICDTNKFNKITVILNEEDLHKIRNYINLIEKAKESLVNYDFISCTHKIHLVLLELNTLIHSTEYWKNVNNIQYCEKIFCVTIECIRIISILLRPFLPELSLSISNYIGFSEDYLMLKYSFFRFSKENIKEIYHDETILEIFDDEKLREFNEIINVKGYFFLNYDQKDKIFISKVKEIKSNSKSKSKSNSNSNSDNKEKNIKKDTKNNNNKI
jgi:methionyl-tRNA synthetase